MKTTKMSLANIQGKLSRAEMKKIMAGSGSCNLGTCGTSGNCSTLGHGCACHNDGGASEACRTGR